MANKMTRMIMVMLLIMGLVAGCASFKKNAFSTLDTTRIAVDTTMQVAGDLYERDVITDDDKNKIIDIHDKYRAVHQMLCEFLKMYENLTDETTKKELKEQIVEAVAELIRLSNEITIIVTEYLQRTTVSELDKVLLRAIMDDHPRVNVTI